MDRSVHVGLYTTGYSKFWKCERTPSGSSPSTTVRHSHPAMDRSVHVGLYTTGYSKLWKCERTPSGLQPVYHNVASKRL
ncbi:hypothetical protein RRG08_040892 [Elysia crispata]|uniref:Uncharacterized protein n=1 Tax=Elysia crispata TaxID=231223 RepID=A0AAE1AZM7_9GAST|nr:hypothetical protein RRG08_040892 [Elysia crispata]